MDAPLVRPGDLLAGKYRVERQLGAGGMGMVVAARHLGLDRPVALKLMLPSQFAQENARARFLREARAPVRLRSQHIAQVFDVGLLDSGAPYIVFEHLDGADLGAVLARRGPLPVAEAVEYVLQACEAVAEAHAAGLVHRDLKPPNLFLTAGADGSPCVKVLDFGISKDTAADLRLTRDQQGIGSPLYMSPEQMRSSADVDARTDVWSMGVVLYELVTGVTPFHTDTIEQLCARVLIGAPTPLGAARPGLPAALEAVLFQCLEKDRDRRFPTLAAFAAALAPFASPRGLPYVDRVAAVLRADVRASHATGELPERTPPGPPPDATYAPARSMAVTPETRPLPEHERLRRSRPAWIDMAAIAAACALAAILGTLVWVGGRALWRDRSAAPDVSTTATPPAASPSAAERPTEDPSLAAAPSPSPAAPSPSPAAPSPSPAAPSPAPPGAATAVPEAPRAAAPPPPSRAARAPAVTSVDPYRRK